MTDTDNAAPAAEFITPATGDAETDKRIASETKTPTPRGERPEKAPAERPAKAAAEPAEKEAAETADARALREAGIAVDDDDADDETEEFDAATDDADNADGEDGDDDEPNPDDFEEIEHDGKKHKLPKELKPLLMMQQDYTRKTQETAEQRKALENVAAVLQTREQAIQQQAELQSRVIGELAELSQVEKQLQAYANIDWNRFDAEDPVEAGRVWRQHELLKQQRQALVGKINEVGSQIEHEKRQAAEAQQRAFHETFAKRQAEAARAFRTANKDVSDETIGKVIDYAQKSMGFTLTELNNVADPRPLNLLLKAYIGEQLIARQRAAAKAKAPAPAEVRPLAPAPRGRTAPASRGLDDRLSAEEWARRRNEQVFGSRRR